MSVTPSTSRLQLALQQIEFARRYTLTLLDGLDESDWHRVPEGCPTHIAWQVGHLSMAMYMLTLFRLRGKTEADERLIPKAFLKRHVKGSTPSTACGVAPSEPSVADIGATSQAAEIRGIFDRVFAQLQRELPGHPDADLDTPVVEPYAVFPTKLGSLLFCAHHEMLHAGQIGLLRRLLGKPPVR